MDLGRDMIMIFIVIVIVIMIMIVIVIMWVFSKLRLLISYRSK